MSQRSTFPLSPHKSLWQLREWNWGSQIAPPCRRLSPASDGRRFPCSERSQSWTPLGSPARLLSLASSREGEGHRAKHGDLPHLFPAGLYKAPFPLKVPASPPVHERVGRWFLKAGSPWSACGSSAAAGPGQGHQDNGEPEGKSLSCWFRYIGFQDGCYFVPVCTSKTVVWSPIIA